jgi:hypothetical protein
VDDVGGGQDAETIERVLRKGVDSPDLRVIVSVCSIQSYLFAVKELGKRGSFDSTEE